MTRKPVPGGYQLRRPTKLTQRENELIDAVMNGATTVKQIAMALGIEAGTVRAMIDTLYLKVDAHNLADLILWRIRQDDDWRHCEIKAGSNETAATSN